jgi:predicted Zn-dependent peptidase
VVIVGIAGPREAAELLDLASPALAELPRQQRETRPPPPSASVAQRTAATEERIAAANEPQVTVVAGLPGVARNHPDRRALELLSYIVGVPSYGGRLGWALTKAGLTYSSAATANFGPMSGHILFSTKCDTRNTDSTIQAIREVIAGVGERGVEEWELREAQAFTLGRAILYGAREESGADAVATALNESELASVDPLDLPAFSHAYLSVTLDDINRVARRYYRAELLKVVAVGAIPTVAQSRIFPDGIFRAIFEP